MRQFGNITPVTAGLEAFDLKVRVIAATALLPVLLAVVLFLPKIYTAILFGLMAAVGAYELMWRTGLVKHLRLLIYGMVMAFAVPMWCAHPMIYPWGALGLFVFICLVLGELLISQTKLPFSQVAITFVAGIVIPLMLGALVRIHGWVSGQYFILIPFALAFLSDTGAYFAGLAFGKHKLAPVISPKKTVEGLVGGVVGAIFGMILYCVVLRNAFDFEVNFLYAAIYGVLGSLASVFGDLCFSAVKRQTGIKDYGNLIPGHGGILDRFDSMTVVAPLVEILMMLIPVAVK